MNIEDIENVESKGLSFSAIPSRSWRTNYGYTVTFKDGTTQEVEDDITLDEFKVVMTFKENK